MLPLIWEAHAAVVIPQSIKMKQILPLPLVKSTSSWSSSKFLKVSSGFGPIHVQTT